MKFQILALSALASLGNAWIIEYYASADCSGGSDTASGGDVAAGGHTGCLSFPYAAKSFKLSDTYDVLDANSAVRQFCWGAPDFNSKNDYDFHYDGGTDPAGTCIVTSQNPTVDTDGIQFYQFFASP